MAFGVIGILSARQLTRVAGHYVLVSSGTLLAGVGIWGQALTAALLFYLVSSTLALSALYLILDPVERNADEDRSEEQTSELQSLMRNSFSGLCLNKKK